MTYSNDDQIRKYVKSHGFISFTKNFGSKYGIVLKNQGSEFGKIAGKKY